MESMGYPQKSVRNHHSTLRKIPKGRRSKLEIIFSFDISVCHSGVALVSSPLKYQDVKVKGKKPRESSA
jgi:hypothetical protein